MSLNNVANVNSYCPDTAIFDYINIQLKSATSRYSKDIVVYFNINLITSYHNK